MGDKPTEVQITVPHVQQRAQWDCGLACAQMALRFLGKNYNDFDLLCTKLNFGTSVWTIDLAHIMAHYNVRHHLFTITLGVDKGYSSKSFYKASFTNDEERVNNMFEKFTDFGVTLSKGSVDLEEIQRHLASGNIAVFLVDWSLLNCKWCSGQKCLPPMRNFVKCITRYQGHFIVVVGYDSTEKLIFYKNPSYTEDLCCCSLRSFDAARKSYGTDEDVLFIYKES